MAWKLLNSKGESILPKDFEKDVDNDFVIKIDESLVRTRPVTSNPGPNAKQEQIQVYPDVAIPTKGFDISSREDVYLCESFSNVDGRIRHTPTYISCNGILDPKDPVVRYFLKEYSTSIGRNTQNQDTKSLNMFYPAKDRMDKREAAKLFAKFKATSIIDTDASREEISALNTLAKALNIKPNEDFMRTSYEVEKAISKMEYDVHALRAVHLKMKHSHEVVNSDEYVSAVVDAADADIQDNATVYSINGEVVFEASGAKNMRKSKFSKYLKENISMAIDLYNQLP